MAPYTPSIPGACVAERARVAPSSTYGRGASQTRRTSGADLKLDKGLATREAVQERAIVIDSDSDSTSDNGGDDEISSSAGPTVTSLPPSSADSLARTAGAESRIGRAATAGLPTTTTRRWFSGWDPVEFKTTPKNTSSHASDHSRLLVKDTNTPSTFSTSKFSDGTYPTKRNIGVDPLQGVSSKKGANIASRGVLGVPSTLASSNTSERNNPPKFLFGSKADDIDNKKNINSQILRQKPTTTAVSTTAAPANRNGILPRTSSLTPHKFLPALKARTYSTPRPGTERSTNNGSNKLKAFGFVSETSPIPETTTVTTQNAAAITSTPILKSNSISHSMVEPIHNGLSRHMEPVQVQSRKPQSSPQTTQNASAPLTPVLKVEAKSISKPTNREAIQDKTGDVLVPSTPENRMAIKQAPTLSSSVGTYGDPYTISSDSDSDDNDDDNGNSKPHNLLSLRRLSSFVETPKKHETASDVEAVLNQFPVWFDSPSPSELRPSYSAMSTPTRPSTTAWPSKRLWDDGRNNTGKEGKQKRCIRFSGHDGLSPSPTKRIATLDRSNYSPTRHISSSVERITIPNKKMTAIGVDTNSNRHASLNLSNNHNHSREFPLTREKSTPTKEKGAEEKRAKKKKKKKKKVHTCGNKTACRYRNQHRETRSSGGKVRA
ncbi:hypothetical protein F5Y12DRAFT_74132 [Xylaria sp. FL1777]|nr:hypothetical protein F5Y12DRAFT_74132 [Xylaria sp. FL1777]